MSPKEATSKTRTDWGDPQAASPDGRLIEFQPGGPEENMAVDQALLESVAANGVPVLRLYGWSKPTLTIGYFQKIGDRIQHSESTGLTCVRRSTGGGGIVHHHELTYSLAIPREVGLAGPRVDLYSKVHGAMIDSLREFGIRAMPFEQLPSDSCCSTDAFLCFQRRTKEDLILSGYKVLGSAQRTIRRAILQHGSLLMQASRWAPQLPGVIDLSSRPVSVQQFAESFSESLATALSMTWTAGVISEAERGRADEITAERFGSPRWRLRR